MSCALSWRTCRVIQTENKRRVKLYTAKQLIRDFSSNCCGQMNWSTKEGECYGLAFLCSKRFRGVWEQRKTEERGFRYFACAENGVRTKESKMGLEVPSFPSPFPPFYSHDLIIALWFFAPELHRNACHAGYSFAWRATTCQAGFPLYWITYCYIARLSLNKMSTVISWFLVTCPWSNSNVSRPGYNCAVVALTKSLFVCFCHMEV